LNNDAPWPMPLAAEARVLDHQRKLHRWARAEPARRFDDLFNFRRLDMSLLVKGLLLQK
jgi:RNA-directed DNA polymerase